MLGALLDLTARVLTVLPGIQREDLPRMADFARIMLALDEVSETKTFQHYTEQALVTSERIAKSDVACIEIIKQITAEWKGSAKDLLDKLTPKDTRPPKGWPGTPQGMGGKLTKAAPTLRSLGWEVDSNGKTSSGSGH